MCQEGCIWLHLARTVRVRRAIIYINSDQLTTGRCLFLQPPLYIMSFLKTTGGFVVDPFKLFFKDSKWLDQEKRRGNPPILISPRLTALLHGKHSETLPVVYIVAKAKFEDMELFTKCLQPRLPHTCSHYQYGILSFESHEALLCYDFYRSKGNSPCYPCRWPEELSEATSNGGRWSEYQVWGSNEILRTADVFGMVKECTSPNSLCPVTTIGLGTHGNRKSIQFSFCRYLYMDLLHEVVDSNGNTKAWEHGDDPLKPEDQYRLDAEAGRRLRFVVARGLPEQCLGCKKTGHGPIYELSKKSRDLL